MPREVRLIIFELEEVASAIREYMISRREIGPLDQVTVEAIRPGDEIFVNVLVWRGTARSERSVAGAQVAAAMIMYCLRRRIPLPHKTRKFLKPVGSALALSFSQGIALRDFDLVLHH